MTPLIEQSESDLHLLAFMKLPVGSIIIQRRGPDEFIVLDINPSAEKVGGWPEMGRENIIGKNMLDIFDRLEESGLVSMYKEVLDTQKELHVGRFAYEDKIIPWSVFDVYLIPISADTFLVSYLNITDRVTSEAKLRISTGELRRSHEELDDFLKIAAHDLNEPLRKINAYSHRLRDCLTDAFDERVTGYVERIITTSARMQTLIDELAKYVEVTTQARPFGPVNLYEVAHEVKTILEYKIEEEQGRLEIADLEEIEADAVQIRLLLQNLISNALKFHRKDVAPVVHLSGKKKSMAGAEESASYQILVRDNGIGFDTADLSRILQPFERLHGKAEYSGTGIGLAICNKIVERHNGEITAESKIGEGTLFIITLPYSQKEANL